MDIDYPALFELLKESTVVRFALMSGTITTLVNYVKRIILKKYPKTNFWYVPFIAMVLGGGAAFVYRLNLFEALGESALQINVGIALTGVLIGGGAQLFYQVLSAGKAVIDAIKQAVKNEPVVFEDAAQ